MANTLSPAVMQALGWTIIHSLWQGAALALAFAALSVILRRNRALIRYAVGLVTLAAVFTVSLITFANLLADFTSPKPTAPWSASSFPAPVQLPASPVVLSAFNDFCHRHAVQVALLWLAGVLFLTLRLMAAWAFSRKIKRDRFYSASCYWQARLQWLCQRINLKKKVWFGESKLVSAPLTIGHFKPIVFFPLGLLSGMPADQVEALLAHELAHILRRDYLVNILQNLVDILYFYHPAVRWLSSRIRQERENCCDDLAAAMTGDSLQVARALAKAQEWAVRRPALALEALGKKSRLLQRIRRLTQMKKMRSSIVERFYVISLVILFLAAAGLSAHGAAVKKRPPVPPAPAAAPVSPASAPPAVPISPAAAADIKRPAPPTVPAVEEDETAKLKAEIAALRKQLQELLPRETLRVQKEKALAAAYEQRLQDEDKKRLYEEMKIKERMAEAAALAQIKEKQIEQARLHEEMLLKQKMEEEKRIKHEMVRIEEEKLKQERIQEQELARLIAEKKEQEEMRQKVEEKMAADMKKEMDLLLKEKAELQPAEQLKKIEAELAVISASIQKLKAKKAGLSDKEKAALKAMEEKTAKAKKEAEGIKENR